MSDVRRAGNETGPFVWQFPGLPIRIVRVLEGDRAGSFAFDQRTLEQVEETFVQLRDLPYYERLPLRGEWEYDGVDGVSPGFYESYVSTPGSLVPSASLLGSFVVGLPDWTKVQRGGQTRWQRIGLVLSLTAAFLVVAAIRSLVLRLARNRSDVAASWILVLWPLAGFTVFDRVGRFIDEDLNVTGDALEWVVVGMQLVLLALSAWLIWRVAMAMAASLTAYRQSSELGAIDASLVQILFSVAAVVVAVAVVVSGLRSVGIDAVPLIAGLGVGGLAIALAIRPTLENLIGGLILHSDRPLRIGDFCTIGGVKGTIEGIGVRSTKIRALDRTLVSIPNARLSDMDIVNFAHCDRLLIEAVLNLRYETTPDQMRHLLASIRRMLHAHPKIDRETVRVRYAGPAASSRDVNIRIYVLTHDWNEFHAVREDVFLRIDDLVVASGVEYAFPSQTLYMARDKSPDPERVASAEAEVSAWRETGDLPFPRQSDREMDSLDSTLDYPPKGSNWSVHGETGIEGAPEPLSDRDAEADTRK